MEFMTTRSERAPGARGLGFAASLVALTFLLPPAAMAEKADRSKPVQVEADAVRLDELKKTSVYEGNVIMTQGTLTLRAARIDVRQDARGFSSGEAVGSPVQFSQKMDNSEQFAEGRANRVEYDAAGELITLIGAAWLKRGEDELRGNRIIYNTRTETYQAEGAVKGVGQGRVRAIIRPKGPVVPDAPKVPVQP